MADLTPSSLEVLAAQRRVIEQVREMAFPDQIGQPIEQDAMTRLLALAEAQAVERAAPTPDPLREAIQFTAIPTLLVFAERNAGVREAVRILRAALAGGAGA